ncbi:ATP-dependent helicase/nuclease subunit B [Sphingomonas gellani]|uniref:ATP-dependent helicase/nuclease subunit B n=1 Tax=Sphingomonas gellani TaxID=1166340 RepID=A0A1H7YJP1_9SPHN|nr:double-strand break repair protein AddB [Sphingomonas gellani]SEM45359.1 ATP-dependent helicase/nuclease subunit B [Sphingomonas gellani]
MAEGARRPQLFTIAGHRAFADSLVAGLKRRVGGDPLALGRTTMLLPNNRAVRAVTDAFVRESGGALLLPRLVALGDPEIGEAIGSALDHADDAAPPAPAVSAYQRRLILTRLITEERAREGQPVGAAEAVRLAGELARVRDQLLVEEVDPSRLKDLDLGPDLSVHWQRALASLEVLLDRWPRELARLGRIDAADRRRLILDAVARRWRSDPPAAPVCAAGITDTAPSVARLLRCVADLPQGMVVFAGLDLAMDTEEWNALGPHQPDPITGRRKRAIEVHPQFHLKVMLDRMDVGRGEVTAWKDAAGAASDAARGRAVANALTPAEFTGKWTALGPADRRLSGVQAAEFATAADEAQGIALTLRQALETPGRTAALVTPDRGLARRVAAHCRRWNIEIDDSAGRPLSILPPGTLLLSLAEVAAQGFAPLALLTLLKHPLVDGGMGRLAWLDGVRAMDLALRGPRPPAGLAGLDGQVGEGLAARWWAAARPLLEPLASAFGDGDQPLARLVAVLRDTAGSLGGDAVWSGPAGRAAADLLAELEAHAASGPAAVDPAEVAPMLRTLSDEVAVRLALRLNHPRLAIYGQIEARLQSADVMILSGLNEGVWPGRPAPDPWLAPRIRAELGLPGLERRIGVAAHDFGQAMGAPSVLITRARRDGSAPALASRFWLRLQAMAEDRLERAETLEDWTRALDDPGEYLPADRPAPSPPLAVRPTVISVTEVDRLKADPYAFYARRYLALSPLEPVDADPTPAWRGNAVHAILEEWWKEDRCAADALRPRAVAMLRDGATHPMLRALWQPRLLEAVDFIAGRVAEDAAAGRHVTHAEGKGRIQLANVTLSGRYDRIDTLPDGKLAIVDYKTGKAPSSAAVRAGFSLQLGLLGVIAERGGFGDVTGDAGAFEYWSMAKSQSGFGQVTSPCDPEGKRDRIVTADFTSVAAANFADAAGTWLTGGAPFTAKLRPEYVNYADYDQLMRRDEWYGRD